MFKTFKDFWFGKLELRKSFWYGLFLIGIIVFFIGNFFIYTINFNLYIFFIFLVLSFLSIGTWRSAENFKKTKLLHRFFSQDYLWAIAAQTYIIFQIILFIFFFLKNL